MIFPEYLETVFYGPAPAAGWPSCFHILTAYNPKRILSEPENVAADNRLRIQLEREQIAHFRISGCSVDLAHQEDSWGFVGISLERAIELGRQYGQHAIFEVLNGEAFVVSCDTLERQSIGHFQDRLKASARAGMMVLHKDSTGALPYSRTPEEFRHMLNTSLAQFGITVKPPSESKEAKDTTTHRFTFRPFPETPPEKRRRVPKEPPATLEALKEQLAALKLKDRVVLVGEFYSRYASILGELTANQMAELIGVEYFSDPKKGPKWRYYVQGRGQMDWYYHKASLTLKSRGWKIVFFTKYNDAEDERSFSVGRTRSFLPLNL